MKKLLILGLFFALFISSGCSLKKTEKPAPNNSNQTGREQNLSEQANTETRLVAKDDFTLEAPANWKESQALVPGVSLMMVNSTENSDRPEIKRINFKSYFSVSYDTLGENSLEQYTANTKKELAGMIAGISFQALAPTIIDGRPAQVFSADLTQQGVNFKLLMFIAEGKNKDIWIISFNTPMESFNGYQGLFSEIATSFRLK